MDNKKNNVWFFGTCAVLIAAFAVLTSMFPYTLDDWAWGTHVGLDRLKTFFAGYNGRYAGNLLVLLLTRSRAADIICMTGCYFLICLLPCRFHSEKRSCPILLLSAFLFLTISRYVFSQTVVWTSGFSNYVPPAVISLAYICAIKDIFKENRKFSVFSTVSFGVLAFIGALFMENITIFNCILGTAAVVMCLVKYKRLNPMHLSWLVGSIAGCIVMFSNSSYGIIADGKDSYRSVGANELPLGEVINTNLFETIRFVFLSNIGMFAVISLLLAVLAVKKAKSGSFAPLLFGIINIAAFVTGQIVYSVKYEDDYYHNIFGVILITCTVMYYLSAIIVSACCIPKETNSKFLILLFSALVSTAPLMIVSPVTARCLFFPLILHIFFAAGLFKAVFEQVIPQGTKAKAAANAVLCVAVSASVIYLLVNFIPVKKYDTLRTEYAKKQTSDGQQQIYICRLPTKAYVYNDYPKTELWEERYKIFLGIDDDTELIYISADEFDRITGNR